MDQIISNPGLYNIVFRILEHLDSESLKSLRMVSKQFEQFISNYYQRQIFVRSLNEVKILDFQSKEMWKSKQKKYLIAMLAYYEKDASLADLKKCAHLFKKYCTNKSIIEAIEEAMETGNKKFIDLIAESQCLNMIYPASFGNLEEIIGDKSKVNTFKFLFNYAELWNIDPFEDNLLVVYACIAKNGEALKTILNHEQFQDNVDDDNITPLQAAILTHNVEMTEILLNSPKIVVNSAHQGYLNEAIQFGNIEIIRQLLSRPDIDVNLEFEGNTPLMKACSDGTPEIVQLLLDRNDINVNAIKSTNGRTPLHMAYFKTRLDIVKVLLKDQRINVNIRDFHGTTPLIHACSQGNIEAVKLFLERDDIKIQFNIVLHLACYFGHVEVVEVLLQHKEIDVNARSKSGKTPLLMICESTKVILETKIKIVKKLLTKKEVDTEVREVKSGLTAMEVARNKGFEEIVWLLEHHGKTWLAKFVSYIKFMIDILE